MEWLAWLVLALIVVVGLGLAGWRVLRATVRGRRFLALPARRKVVFGRALLSTSGVPWPARVLVVVLVGYLALPFDLVPDFIPVLGQLDDVLVVMGIVALLLAVVPRDAFERAMAAAEAQPEA